MSRADNPALRGLIAAACVVVVIAGLKVSGDILLPILFSAFLSILTVPLVRELQRKGVPSVVAVALVVVVSATLLFGLSALVGQTVRTFTTEIGGYEGELNALRRRAVGWAQGFGVPIEVSDVAATLSPGSMMGVVGQAVNAVLGVFGQLLIVVVTMTFILFEASELEAKLRVAFRTEIQPAGPFVDAGPRVQRYLIIKTAISLLTGVCAGILCRVIGVDFWVMWGLIAFLLNYIPSVGSIVASIPPVMLAIVQFGVGPAAALGAGYFAINVALGNLLEPRLLGQSLGLSPLVIFLSLVFWGWLWGPAGMLLCVPMTVIAKLVLESHESTKWIAVLLGSARAVRAG